MIANDFMMSSIYFDGVISVSLKCNIKNDHPTPRSLGLAEYSNTSELSLLV